MENHNMFMREGVDRTRGISAYKTLPQEGAIIYAVQMMNKISQKTMPLAPIHTR